MLCIGANKQLNMKFDMTSFISRRDDVIALLHSMTSCSMSLPDVFIGFSSKTEIASGS